MRFDTLPQRQQKMFLRQSLRREKEPTASVSKRPRGTSNKVIRRSLYVVNGRRCKICCRRPPHQKSGRRRITELCVDHLHGTSLVRGLLCHGCNSGLGFFRDSPTLLRLAAEYLETSLPEDMLPPDLFAGKTLYSPFRPTPNKINKLQRNPP